jgi:hypothetical protein
MVNSVINTSGVELLGDEWQGLALDFLTNAYATRTATQAEQLLGPGPYTAELGLGLSFTDNTYSLFRRSDAELNVTQDDQTLSATAALTLSEAPCVLRANAVVHGIVASSISYVILSASASYPRIKYRTCWNVVADREAA